jgi:hypothetical protein
MKRQRCSTIFFCDSIPLTGQGGTAEAASDAIDRTIDSVTKAAVFSRCKSKTYEKTAEEQQHTNYIFMYC